MVKRGKLNSLAFLDPLPFDPLPLLLILPILSIPVNSFFVNTDRDKPCPDKSAVNLSQSYDK
jgi:hypothetical protein